MSEGSDVILLCEGYDDRSFWKGLLLRMGCKDERKPRGKRYQKTDVYSFRSPGGAVVYVVPAQQAIGVTDLAKDELRSRVDKPFSRMILNVDIDVRTVEDARRAIANAVREVDETAVEEAGEFLLDGGRTRVSFVPRNNACIRHRWEPAPAGCLRVGNGPHLEMTNRINTMRAALGCRCLGYPKIRAHGRTTPTHVPIEGDRESGEVPDLCAFHAWFFLALPRVIDGSGRSAPSYRVEDGAPWWS